MKEKLRKAAVILSLVGALAGCRDNFNIESKLVYGGMLKRGQPVSYTYKGEEHQVTFDSLRVLNSQCVVIYDGPWGRIDYKEESAIRYFTLDGESRPIIEATGDRGNYISWNDLDTHPIKTKRFQIKSSPTKGDLFATKKELVAGYPAIAKGDYIKIKIHEEY